LGGAFNPITYGHIGLAQFVLQEVDIDEFWFTPCYSLMYGKDMAPCPDRIAMVRMAIRNRPKMDVFRFEIDRKLTGGTFEFLFKLLSDPIYGWEHEFSYIIGMDNANTFDKWKNYERLQEMVRFIVVDRKGIDREAQSPRDAWYLKRPHLYLASMGEVIECSSTIVRDLVKENRAEEAKYYTLPEVLGYISNLGLYRCQDEEVQEGPEQERVQGDAG
jgi:nicotinate-nucleotide adenylyltransferase